MPAPARKNHLGRTLLLLFGVVLVAGAVCLTGCASDPRERQAEILVAEFQDACRQPEKKRREPWQISRALADLGTSAVPVLVQALKDKNSDTRSLAAEALFDMGPRSKDAVPALIQALKDEVSGVRRVAALALCRIGPGAKDAVPALTEILKDQDESVRWAARAALRRIQPPPHGPPGK